MTYQQIISGFVAVLFLLSTGLLSTQAQQQEEEFQQLYEEYLEINQRLQELQQQALQDEEVAEHYETYSEFLDEKLKETDERAAELVEKRQDTIELIETAQEAGDFERMQELQQGYQQLNQELQPFMQEVMADPEVQQEREEFEEVLIDKMEDIDPETMPLLNRMNELSNQLDRLMQQRQQ